MNRHKRKNYINHAAEVFISPESKLTYKHDISMEDYSNVVNMRNRSKLRKKI